MKILLTVNDMSQYNGSALSTYEMARVLSEDHDVTVVCGQGGWTDNVIRKNLRNLDVVCGYEWEPEYDLIIGSHHIPDVKGYKINIVRGITEWETPIKGCDAYVSIRPNIQEHIKEESILIYNGVDRTRFKSIVKSERDHIKMIAPCNVDSIRHRWLKMMIEICNKERQLYIYTKETEFKLPESPWVHYEKPIWNMEEVIADADVVVGVYLGRVNLEARSCGVNSIFYDPYTFLAEPFEISDKDFDRRHNINNVVKKLLKLYEGA